MITQSMICRFYPRARTCVLFLAFQHRGMAEIAMNNSRFPNRIWTVHAKTLCFARRPIHLSTLRLSRYFRFPPLCGFAMPSICSSFSTRSAVDRHPRFRGSNRVKFVPTFNCLAIGALARITTHQSTIPNVLLRCQPFSETILHGRGNVPFNPDEIWTQEHVCRICGAKWTCGYTMCWEGPITECRKCKCGLPECFLMTEKRLL